MSKNNNIDVISKFNLPTYVKGKSFSEASALIAKRFKDRNSPEDIATLNELQGRLKEAQESVKAEQERKSNPQGQQEQGGSQNQFVLGGETRESVSPIETMPIAGLADLGATQELAGKVDLSSAKGAGDAAKGAGAAAGAPGAGAYVGAATTAIDLGKKAFGPTGIDTSGASPAPDVPSAGGAALAGAAKGAAAGAAFGPWGAAIGGVVGGAAGFIGGGKAKRDAIEAAKSYTFGQQDNASSDYEQGGYLNTEDMAKKKKSGGKLLANMYHEGGLVGHLHNDVDGIDYSEGMKKKDPIKGGVGSDIDFQQSNDNAMAASRVGQPIAGGDPFVPRPTVSPISALKQAGIAKMGYDGSPDSIYSRKKLDVPEVMKAKLDLKGLGMKDSDLGRYNTGSETINKANAGADLEASALEAGKNIGKTPVPVNSDEKKKDKFNYGELLRYAPAAMNLAQLANLKKPEGVALDRLGNRYQEQRVDERGLQNTVQNSISNNRDAILSASGGSGSAARASLLASQLQGTKAESNAYQSATGENRQDRRKGQEFNAGIDKVNLGQSNNETNLNLEQQAAYQTNKSKLLSQLGTDLGGVGTEEMYKRFPELMGLSYGAKGEHLATKAREAEEKKAAKAAKAAAKANKKTTK